MRNAIAKPFDSTETPDDDMFYVIVDGLIRICCNEAAARFIAFSKGYRLEVVDRDEDGKPNWMIAEGEGETIDIARQHIDILNDYSEPEDAEQLDWHDVGHGLGYYA